MAEFDWWIHLMKKKLFVAYIWCQNIKFSYKNKYNIINDIVLKYIDKILLGYKLASNSHFSLANIYQGGLYLETIDFFAILCLLATCHS